MEILATGETDRVSSPTQGRTAARNTIPTFRPSSDVILVLLLALVSAATLLWLIREPNFVDDADYFEYASWLLEGEPGRPRIANLYRLGFVSAVAAAQGLFGYTPTAYYVVSIGFSVGAVVALYVFSRTLRFPRMVALSAAVLLLTSPIFLEYATILRVDWPAIFWTLLGLSALVVGVRSDAPYRMRLLMSVAAGILLFFALWTKEGTFPAVAASPLVVLGVRRDSHSWKLLGITAGTGALMLTGELLLLAWQYGDPLARVSAILGGHVTGAATGWVERGLVSADLTWWDLAFRYPQLLLETTYGTIFVIASIGGLVTALATWRRELLILGALGLCGTVFVSLAVVSIDPLVPLLRSKARYFSIAFVFFLPLVVGSVWVVFQSVGNRIMRFRTNKSWRDGLATIGLIVLVSVVMLVGLSQAQDEWYLVKNGADAMSQSRETILSVLADEDRPLHRILTGRMTKRVLEMYVPYEARDLLMSLDFNTSPSRFDFRRPDDFHPGDLVVLNLSRLQNNARYGFYEDGSLPGFLFEPPLDWVERGRSDWRTFRIYYVEPLERWEVDPLLEPPGGFEARFHAYPFEADDGIVEHVDDRTGSFVLRQAEDVRIVLGSGRYHLRPRVDGLDEALHVEEGGFAVELVLRVEDEIALDWVTTWIFEGETEKPIADPLTEVEREGGRIVYVGRLEIGSEGGSFRVMIKASGDGQITVEDLTVTRIK